VKKIPTLFVRDEKDRRYVTSQVTPGCEWVLNGEGTPTRKYDGTCILIRRDGLAVKAFARREVKAGKTAPPGFVPIETDDTTGKTVGWEPAGQSSYAKYIEEALAGNEAITPGTYELVGPKVQGNPEEFSMHVLVPHGADVLGFVQSIVPSYDWAKEWMPDCPYEGIVWHHPDGRMAKLKKRDFPR
jgi:Family of unknown function (DUF5565)